MADLDEALLATVVENPDDDEPRLVYADFLQQRGDPRGEFIAVQVARSRGDSSPTLFQREHQLLSEHHAKWAAELGLEARQVVFERGFASSIGLVPLPRLLELEQTIFTRAPIVRLAFDGLGPEDMSALVASSCLNRVKDLILDNNAIGERGARMLAESPRSSKLVRLSLWSNGVGTNGAVAIADSPFLTNLRQLDLSYNGIGPTGIRAVLASPGLKALTRLGLASAGLGRTGARILTGAAPRPTLEALNLSENGIDDAHSRRLADAPLFETLTTLFLASNRFGDEGLKALVERGRFTRLHTLDLSYTNVGDEGVAALAGSARFATLRRLRLGKLRRAEGSLTDAGALSIASSPHLGGLEELLLVGNGEIGSAAKRRIESRFGKGFIDRIAG